MTARKHFCSLLFAAIVCMNGDGHAGTTPDEEVRLRRGEVVANVVQDRGPGGRLVAAIDIPAAPSVVWAVMRDCERAPEYVPGLDSCRILESSADGSSDVREHRIRWISLLPRLTVRFRSNYIAEREIRVARTGGDLTDMQGTWTLEPLDGGEATRLHYDFRMVPSTFLPSGLVRAGLLRDAPQVLEAVRTEVIRVSAR
jgi:ribosome-associated toxin RatA of RatAB toxin-antitoxin module